MSAKEMRKLLCEFINGILTDLDSGGCIIFLLSVSSA